MVIRYIYLDLGSSESVPPLQLPPGKILPSYYQYVVLSLPGCFPFYATIADTDSAGHVRLEFGTYQLRLRLSPP